MKKIFTQLITAAATHNRIILLTGPRQVGKTHEMHQLAAKYPNPLYFDLEKSTLRGIFDKPTVPALEELIGPKDQRHVIFIDEVQNSENFATAIDLIQKNFPQTHLFATGSSQIDLTSPESKGLAHIEAFPLTFREITEDTTPFNCTWGSNPSPLNKSKIEALIDTALVYGTLPEVHFATKAAEKEEILQKFVQNFLYRDLFEIEDIRHPHVFKKLLTQLALNLGQPVNPNQLAKTLQVSRNTITDYIALYEKYYVIHQLKPYSTNPKTELNKKNKIYFTDLGLHNALIGNFNSPNLRTDTPALFENLVINNFRTLDAYYDCRHDLYFWQSRNGFQLPLLLHDSRGTTADLSDDSFIPVAIDYSKQTPPTKSFENNYPEAIEAKFTITKENFWKFV